MAQDNDGRTPLHLAAGQGHARTVQALLDWDNRTPLHLAAGQGHARTVQALLDWDSQTPLDGDNLMFKRYASTGQVLLDWDSNPNAAGSFHAVTFQIYVSSEKRANVHEQDKSPEKTGERQDSR
jgi:ankyrin repeat protein